MPAMFHVGAEGSDDAIRIGVGRFQRDGEVEQIAAFLSLIERAQLRAEQFVEAVCPDIARSFEPSGRYGKRHCREAVDGEMLAGVNLDLEAKAKRRRVFRLEAVIERDAAFALFPLRLAKPRIENRPESVHDRTGRFRQYLDEIDIFGVARRRFQIQLVERRPAAKRERPGKKLMGEDRDKRTADNEVLLDLKILNPRCFRPPFGDVVAGDQLSASTSALTNSFQSASRAAEFLGAPVRSRTASRAFVLT